MTPEAALEQLGAAHGFNLTPDGRCPGGEVGAHYARAEDGRRLVYKWYPGAHRLEALQRVVDRAERLRDRGYLMPVHLPPFAVAEGVVIVQEAVPGACSDEVSRAFVHQLLELNDLQAGLHDSGAAWTAWIRSTLLEGAAGFCLRETLASYDAETRELLAWIDEVGKTHPDLPARDVVHVDFHHRNVLREGERLTAVVDWDGCAYGDRAFDLVTFCFGFSHAVAELGAEELAWSRARELASVEILAPYVAHMALRRVDWTIRFHPEDLGVLMPVVRRYRDLVWVR